MLDFGCGTGWFTAELSRFGRATGMDLSETVIAHARATYAHVPFIAANLFETPFPADRFDEAEYDSAFAAAAERCGGSATGRCCAAGGARATGRQIA